MRALLYKAFSLFIVSAYPPAYISGRYFNLPLAYHT